MNMNCVQDNNLLELFVVFNNMYLSIRGYNIIELINQILR